jgi:hypothetical protein
MGKFSYEGQVRAEFEDRLLAHLQIVIGNKLRRGESFYFTWPEDHTLGGGRVSVWMHPHSGLVFEFAGSRPPNINRDWVEALAETANSTAGLHIVSETQHPSHPTRERELVMSAA